MVSDILSWIYAGALVVVAVVFLINGRRWFGDGMVTGCCSGTCLRPNPKTDDGQSDNATSQTPDR